MKIKFYGNTCFSIGDSSVTLVTDPHETVSSLKANAVTVSQRDPEHNNVSAIQGTPKILDWPGEYESSGVHIQGIASFHNAKEDKEQKENTIFTFGLNGIRLCHLGCIGTKPTPEQLEEVGDVDVLFIPVGGKGCIDAKKAKEVIEQIEPRIIIPMAYSSGEDKGELGPIAPFLQEMGAQAVLPVDEFDFKRSDLPEDSSKVVILNKQ